VIFVAAFLAFSYRRCRLPVLTGETPVFALQGMPVAIAQCPAGCASRGAIAGFGGVLFNRCLLASLDGFERLRRWPPFALGALVGLTVGFAAWIYPEVSGSGVLLAEHAMAGEIAIRGVVVLVAARSSSPMLSYGSGSAGGIFAPLL